jgi:hypothetical protein
MIRFTGTIGEKTGGMISVYKNLGKKIGVNIRDYSATKGGLPEPIRANNEELIELVEDTPKEGPFPLGFKLPNVTGHHRSHRHPFNTLSYAL